MGNYSDFEYDFIDRTLAVISQYDSTLHKYEFKEQYNYTLLLNCLTGLIVMPKERTIDMIPKERLITDMKKQMGLHDTQINPTITTVKDLVIQMRHCVAHFSIRIESENDEFLINRIVFYDEERGAGYIVATFKATELLPFVRYYADWLKSNLQTSRRYKQLRNTAQ